MKHASSSNIGRHKPNYAILFCLLVVVGDLGLQIVPIRVKALLSDSDSGKSNEAQSQWGPVQPIVPNNWQPNSDWDDNLIVSGDGNENQPNLETFEVGNSNENNINHKKNSDSMGDQLVPKGDELSISDSVRQPQPMPNGEQLTESVPEPIEHQLNESASEPKDDQIPPKGEPETDKQLLEENQVFELTTMLCQQKKIIENCYKIYNEGSSSGLKYAKQQELKKLVEDAKKIQADCNEKVNEFELPELVEKFREQINSNLDKIKGKLSDKTDLNKEYDQLEPAEMTVPIDYLERSKFWRFFSDHKKALIYGSIGVGVGALAAVIGGGIYSYKNKKLSGNIPDWEIDVNEQWPTKPNKSSFTKKLVMVVGLVVLMAIILAVVAFFVHKTASKNSSANKRQQPQPPPQPNQPTETPTDTNNANTNTTTGTENVDETGAATGPTPATTTTNKTNKSKQSARKSTIKSDKKSARKSRLTNSNKAHGEKSKAKSTIQPAKSKGSGIGGQRRRSQAQPRSSMVAKSVI